MFHGEVQFSAIPSFIRYRLARPFSPHDLKHYTDYTAYTARLMELEALSEVCLGFSEHVMDMRSGSEEKQFHYVQSMFHMFHLLPESLASPSERRAEMFDVKLAASVRFSGNDRFRNGKYGEALDRYTESLIMSEPGTLDYALALANRSAALYHLEEYRLCADDVWRALRFKYPKRAAYKLVERAGNAERKLGNYDAAISDYTKCLSFAAKSQVFGPHLGSDSVPCITDDEKIQLESRVQNAIQQCKELLERGEQPSQDRPFERRFPVPHLLGGRNEKIPAFSKHLELRPKKFLRDHNIPRGVFATCDINPGDVVAIDEPYISGPSSYYNSICHYSGCLKMCIAVIPCPKCSLAYYCNEECIRNDLQDGHNVLCPIMFSIVKLPGKSDLNVLALKWLVKEIKNLGIEKFRSDVNKLKNAKVNDVNEGFDENGQFKSDNFLAALTMRKYRLRTSIDFMLLFHCIAVDMLQYLMLSGFEIPKPYMKTFGASLVNMLLILDINCGKMLSHNPSRSNEGQIIPIANALYPSLGLINHSCDPNVKRCGILSDKTRVLKAIQPIPKGSQLFISYGVTFKKDGKTERYNFLKNYFKFMCYCRPCVENWPLDRFIAIRLSSLNLVNSNLVEMLTLECKRFIDFKKSTAPDDFHKHLNYLYSFIKLMSVHVKRPYKLYEDCLEMLEIAHTYFRNNEQKFVSEFFQSDRNYFQPDVIFEDI